MELKRRLPLLYIQSIHRTKYLSVVFYTSSVICCGWSEIQYQIIVENPCLKPNYNNCLNVQHEATVVLMLVCLQSAFFELKIFCFHLE